MKLVTFVSADGAHLGALVEGEIADLTAAGGAPTMRALIEGGATALRRAQDAVACAVARREASEGLPGLPA